MPKLYRSISEVTLAPSDLHHVTQFFTEVLGFEKTVYTFDGDGDIDPIVRHGDVEIRFYRGKMSPSELCEVGVTIDCDSCEYWVKQMRRCGIDVCIDHDVGQRPRVEHLVVPGFFVAFEERSTP